MCAERERLFSHTYMRNPSPFSQTGQQPSLRDVHTNSLSLSVAHKVVVFMNLHVCLRASAPPRLLSPVKNEKRRNREQQANGKCTYNQTSNTHTYNTPPLSTGSEGHIPPPQSASGFHTLVQECVCVCARLWVDVSLGYFSDLWGVRPEGKKWKENKEPSLQRARVNPKIFLAFRRPIFLLQKLQNGARLKVHRHN